MAKIVITNSDGSIIESNEFSLGGGGSEFKVPIYALPNDNFSGAIDESSLKDMAQNELGYFTWINETVLYVFKRVGNFTGAYLYSAEVEDKKYLMTLFPSGSYNIQETSAPTATTKSYTHALRFSGERNDAYLMLMLWVQSSKSTPLVANDIFQLLSKAPQPAVGFITSQSPIVSGDDLNMMITSIYLKSSNTIAASGIDAYFKYNEMPNLNPLMQNFTDTVIEN